MLLWICHGLWAWHPTFEIGCNCVWYTESIVPNLVYLALIIAAIGAFIQTDRHQTDRRADGQTERHTAMAYWTPFDSEQEHLLCPASICLLHTSAQIKYTLFFDHFQRVLKKIFS